MGGVFAREIKAKQATPISKAQPKQEAGVGRRLVKSASKGRAYMILGEMARNMRRNILG